MFYKIGCAKQKMSEIHRGQLLKHPLYYGHELRFFPRPVGDWESHNQTCILERPFLLQEDKKLEETGRLVTDGESEAVTQPWRCRLKSF